MISATAAIAIIMIGIRGVVSFSLKLVEVRFLGSVEGDCEVEFSIEELEEVGLGVSLGKGNGAAVGVVSTGAEGKGCVWL